MLCAKITMNLLPIDIVQLIGLYTQSTVDYLHIALCCKQYSKILANPRRQKALQHFTKITTDQYGIKEWRINGKKNRIDGEDGEIICNDTCRAIGQDAILKSKYLLCCLIYLTIITIDWYVRPIKYVRIDDPWFKRAYECFESGKLHRENGPAVEWAEHTHEGFHWAGYAGYWNDGVRHRIGGPASVWSNGNEHWWEDGLRHRIDGPAVTYYNNRRKQWCKQYWVRGKRMTKEEFEKIYLCC